jgi:hypothetical protein
MRSRIPCPAEGKRVRRSGRGYVPSTTRQPVRTPINIGDFSLFTRQPLAIIGQNECRVRKQRAFLGCFWEIRRQGAVREASGLALEAVAEFGVGLPTEFFHQTWPPVANMTISRADTLRRSMERTNSALNGLSATVTARFNRESRRII